MNGFNELKIHITGHREGEGIASFGNGDGYYGMYRADKRHGRGVYTWEDGNEYDGMFQEDVRHGFGILKRTYKLPNKQGKPNGENFSRKEVFIGGYSEDGRFGGGWVIYSKESKHGQKLSVDIGTWKGKWLMRLGEVFFSLY